MGDPRQVVVSGCNRQREVETDEQAGRQEAQRLKEGGEKQGFK